MGDFEHFRVGLATRRRGVNFQSTEASREGDVLLPGQRLVTEKNDLVREQRRALERRAVDLEAQLDGWARGNVAVALVGRVPVKADGATLSPLKPSTPVWLPWRKSPDRCCHTCRKPSTFSLVIKLALV